ncbi:hypothetical protein ACFL3D_02320 [Candidatus Omnitrophota bacterium]
MRYRAMISAIIMLSFFFCHLNAPFAFAQGSLSIAQNVGHVVIAETPATREIPFEESVTTSEIPVIVPEFYVEPKIEEPSKKKRIRRFFSFKWFDFLKWFWTKPKIDEDSESVKLLREWEEMLGFDAFYVYYKAQEARKIIKKKFSYKIFGMRATADYRDGKIFLIFKRKF